MEINLKDYLSEDEMKEIARSEVRAFIAKQLNDENDLKRFLSNIAYEVVSEFCDKTLDNTMMHEIQINVERVVKNLGEFSVFKKPNAWDTESNGMYKFLHECLDKQKPMIEEIVANNTQVQAAIVLKEDVKNMVQTAILDYYGAS